ncbi:hypothetical protein EG832_22090, partial [bacterium]|nr:hypothetical protein [bacterium]
MIYKRPRLCIHEGMNRAWLGQVDDADLLLNEAEKRIQEGASTADTRDMLGNIAYIRSRITAMRGDIRRAIELGLTARELTPANNQALLGGIDVMLGYAYFLDGDFSNAIRVLNETIHSGKTAGAINTTVAAYCVLARLYTVQGQLHQSFELYQEAGKLANEAGGRQPGVMSIVDVGIADVMIEWNDLKAALTHVKKALEVIPLWNKKDDIALAYTTLSRIQLAQKNLADAVKTIENGSQVILSGGVFSEARDAVISAEIKLRLAQGNHPAVGHLIRSLERRLDAGDPFRFENELAFITLARVFTAQKKTDEAIRLLSRLEDRAQS